MKLNSKNAYIQTTALLLLFSLATLASKATAQNVIEKHADVLSTYVTDDVVAVVYLDLEHLDLEQAIDAGDAIGFSKKELFYKLINATPQINGEIAKLKSAGVTAAFGLLRMSDLDTMDSTSWVFPVNSGKSESAAAVIKGLEFGELPNPFSMVESVPGVVLACGNENQMACLKQDAPTDKRSLSSAAEGLGASSIGLVVIGSKDSRRAIRELLPPLPAPFTAMTGGLLADQTKWFGVSLSLNKDIGARVVVEANDEAAAKQYSALASDAMKLVMSVPGSDDYVPADLKSTLLEGLTPEQSGSRVVISTERLMADRDRLTKILSPAIKSARILAAENQQRNTLRQFALACHNYESAHKHFPTQASTDDNGQPLLSWRVQILPFINQNELWKEFHLDEPWDSEHNLKLVKKMPTIFKDAGPNAFQNNQDGKTIYLGAAGEGMMFNGATEITFGDMKDGSSNTILIAAVAAEHAVPWTKPVDWQVDLKNPTAQLIEGKRTHVRVAIGDGSVQALRLNMSVKNWVGLLTFDGGEIVTEW